MATTVPPTTLAPPLLDESFEGSGYENSWTETVESGCTLDEDSAIPGTPPDGSGSQCLKAIVTDNTNNDAYATHAIGNTNVWYVRGYIYLSEEGFGNNQVLDTLQTVNVAGSIAAGIQIGQSGAGALVCKFRYYSNGSINTTADIPISLNTWYNFEYKYDVTAMEWEWRINSVTKHNGSLISSIVTPNKLIAGIKNNYGTGQTTLYTDLVVIDNDWTTLGVTTAAPTTVAPTTLAPTTLTPTTLAPTTLVPTTLSSTTLAPTTLSPTTLPSTTLMPTTVASTTTAPTTTSVPTTTSIPTTPSYTTIFPTTAIIATTTAPTTIAPTTLSPTTLAPTTAPPTTLAPTTIAPTTGVPTTPAPLTTGRLFIDSFDSGGLYAWEEASLGASIVSTTGLDMEGTYCTHLSFSNGYVKEVFSDHLDIIFCAFYYRPLNDDSTVLGVFSLSNDSGVTTFRVELANKILKAYIGPDYTSPMICVGTGTINLEKNTTYHIEIKFVADDAPDGRVEIKVGGVTDILWESGTVWAGNYTFRRVKLGFDHYSHGNSYINNVVMDKDDWIGVTKIVVLTPTGVGNSSDWTPSAGNNWNCVDEIPPVEADYVHSDSIDLTDTYEIENAPYDVGEIKSIQAQSGIDYTGTPVPTGIQAVIRVGGIDYLGVNTSIDSDDVKCLWENNPDDLAIWEKTDIDNLEIGVKSKTYAT